MLSLSKTGFGIRLPVAGPLANMANLLKVAKMSEEMHYDIIWVSDHIMWTSKMINHIGTGSLEAVKQDQDPDVFESITTLSYLAGVVKQIKLGLAVLVPVPRHPVVLAKQLANLDILSHGRLRLGIGIGSKGTSAESFAAFKMPFNQRGKMVDEYIISLKEIWTKKVSSFSGNFVNFENVEVYPKPQQKPYPKILTGGFSTAAIRRAAKLGDGWLPGFLTPDQVRDGLGKIKDIRKSLGLTSEGFHVSMSAFTSISDDAKDAEKIASKTITSRLASMGKEKLSVAPSFEEAKKLCLFGNPHEITDRIGQYVDAGVDDFELHLICHNMESFVEMMELYATEVIPSFK